MHVCTCIHVRVSILCTHKMIHAEGLALQCFSYYFSDAVLGQLTVTVDSTATTSITLSGSVPSGSVVTSYEVMWQRDTSLECPDVEDDGSVTISGDFTEYTITGLEEDSSYIIIITVTVFNEAGGSEDTVTAMTEEAGEI